MCRVSYKSYLFILYLTMKWRDQRRTEKRLMCLYPSNILSLFKMLFDKGKI